MSDYQGRQVDEQPHGHTPSITNRSRKARGDCKRSINVISLRVMKRGNYNMQRCKKTEGNKLLLLLLLLLLLFGLVDSTVDHEHDLVHLIFLFNHLL